MRRVALLGLAVAVFALAGCGGGGGGSKPLTKDEYQKKITQIAKDVSASIGSTASSKMISKADEAKVTQGLNQFADELEKVSPPLEVKDLHTQLVAAMREFGNEFPELAAKLRNAKDAGAVITALTGLPAIRKLSKLQADFKTKGYELNLNS